MLIVDLAQFHSFRVGSQYNYVPMYGDTALRGTQVDTGTITSATSVAPSVGRIVVELSPARGNYNFGEVALYDFNGNYVGIVVNAERLSKFNSVSATPNTIVVEILHIQYLDEFSLIPFWHVSTGAPIVWAYDAAVAGGYVGDLESWALGLLSGAPSLLGSSGSNHADFSQVSDFDPSQFDHFRLGTGTNYTPSPSDSDVRGDVVYVGDITRHETIGNRAYRVIVELDSTVGDFEFGEIGLYKSTGELICLSVTSQVLNKVQSAGADPGNAITIEVYFIYDYGRFESKVVYSVGYPAPPPAPGVIPDRILATRQADIALGGHRIVRSQLGLASYASVDTVTHGDDVLGMTTEAVSAGAPVEILVSGRSTEPSWNWAPGELLFLGVDGQMVQTPVANPAFDLVVGFAETATTIFIKIGDPIYHEE